MNKKVSLGAAICFMAIAAAVTFTITMYFSLNIFNSKIANVTERDNFYDKIAEIDTIVRNNFLEDIDEDRLMDYVADGYMAGLDDPYTYYMNQEEYKAYQMDNAGELVGIGVTVIQDESGYILVKGVEEGSPAENAGIQAGDLIVKVGDIDVLSEGYNEAVTAVRGEEGTTVVLTIRRDNEDLQVEAVRKLIKSTTISYRLIGDNGYIKISKFDETTFDDFKNAVSDLQSQGATGLIFDVRNNPGGLLDSVADVTQRAADYIVQQAALPKGAELDALNTKLEIIGESAEAYLFFTDESGNILIASNPEMLDMDTVEQALIDKVSGDKPYHTLSTLDGVLTEKSYVSVRHMQDARGNNSGYLFLCSSGARLTDFKEEFWSNFFFSACVMLLCASVLTSFLMRKLTDPLQKITDAAQRFGGGDFSVRVEGVEGEGEVVDLARTFNQMAENIQSNDNSRGQFMGNIAHELRTPMTTIKGFVDGILDGTIPPDMQNHYLQLVSEETGRLARLIQNMLDLSKLESGEYQVNARMFNIWETLTGVALSAEQRINDGMIDLEGLTMDEKVLVYADPDLIHQVAYNILDNAIKFTPAGGTIKFHVEKLGPEVEISIWNSGQGISPEALPYVFQRFYKEDRSRGLHARGAGLGLNICKVLVNLSGGQIRVESQQGEWCQFVFTLPATPPNPSGMKRLPDESGQPVPVEDPASMKPVN